MVVDLVRERSSTGSELGHRTTLGFLIATALAVTGCLGAVESGETSGSVGGDGAQAAPELGIEPIDSGIVDRVVDGDTVDILFGDQVERVRLVGIDAPESVARDQPVHCFGVEASQALKDLLPAGTELRVSRDVEARDRYDRLLLYLYRADDGLFVNEWLAAQGFAESRSYEPNVAHQTTLDQARDRARSDGIGLWGHCDGPEQPLG